MIEVARMRVELGDRRDGLGERGDKRPVDVAGQRQQPAAELADVPRRAVDTAGLWSLREPVEYHRDPVRGVSPILVRTASAPRFTCDAGAHSTSLPGGQVLGGRPARCG